MLSLYWLVATQKLSFWPDCLCCDYGKQLLYKRVQLNLCYQMWETERQYLMNNVFSLMQLRCHLLSQKWSLSLFSWWNAGIDCLETTNALLHWQHWDLFYLDNYSHLFALKQLQPPLPWNNWCLFCLDTVDDDPFVLTQIRYFYIEMTYIHFTMTKLSSLLPWYSWTLIWINTKVTFLSW